MTAPMTLDIEAMRKAAEAAISGVNCPKHPHCPHVNYWMYRGGAVSPANVFALITDRDALLARAERAEAERDEARYRPPMGDNHHNAMKCPHCNPKQIDPTAEKARADRAEAELQSQAAKFEENKARGHKYRDKMQARIDALEAKIARDRATIEKLRNEVELRASKMAPKNYEQDRERVFLRGQAHAANAILAAIKGDEHE